MRRIIIIKAIFIIENIINYREGKPYITIKPKENRNFLI